MKPEISSSPTYEMTNPLSATYTSYPTGSINPIVTSPYVNPYKKYDTYLGKNILNKGESASSYMMTHAPDPKYKGMERAIVEKQTILDFFMNIFNVYSKP
jgi:hypothetical protein